VTTGRQCPLPMLGLLRLTDSFAMIPGGLTCNRVAVSRGVDVERIACQPAGFFWLRRCVACIFPLEKRLCIGLQVFPALRLIDFLSRVFSSSLHLLSSSFVIFFILLPDQIIAHPGVRQLFFSMVRFWWLAQKKISMSYPPWAKVADLEGSNWFYSTDLRVSSCKLRFEEIRRAPLTTSAISFTVPSPQTLLHTIALSRYLSRRCLFCYNNS